MKKGRKRCRSWFSTGKEEIWTVFLTYIKIFYKDTKIRRNTLASSVVGGGWHTFSKYI